MFDHTVITARRTRIETNDPFPTNVGGSSGPKVVTCTFAVRIGRGYYSRAMTSIDLPREEFQDAFAIRRRAAHASVGLGRRAAAGILSGKIAPVLERQRTSRKGPPTPYVILSFCHDEEYEGYARRALVTLEFLHEPLEELPPIAEMQVEHMAAALRGIADDLHGAVGLPANRHLFGVAG